MSKVTIVSALYYIGRDRWKSSGFGPNNDRYKNWVKNLLSLDADIYFYVDDFYYDYVVDFRKKYDPEFKKTTIVRESLDSMYFYKKYFNDESCLMFSPEFRKRVWFKDSADMCYPIYHIINFTKIDFVKRASEVNPYNSDYFFWVDAGGMRENFEQYENVKWPNENSEFLNDKIIHFSHHSSFEIYPNKDQYFLSQTRNIQGTAWIVPKNKIDHFFNLIDNQVSTIISEKIVGSDEKVYDFLFKNNEDLYQLVVCGWFKFFDVMKISNENDVKSKHHSHMKYLSDHEGYQLPQTHQNYLTRLKEEFNFTPKVIYDVGACVLHWSKAAKKIWPNSKYYLFDGMEESEELYKEMGYEYHIGVLSDVDDKEVTFYKNTEMPFGNSYYMENPEYCYAAKSLFGNPENQFKRKTITLDTVRKNKNFEYPDLLKIDVQGCEIDILKGSQDILQHVKHLIVELQNVDYNIGAQTDNITIPIIESMGFKLVTPKFSSNVYDSDYHFVRIEPQQNISQIIPTGKKVFIDMGAHEQQGLGQFKNILNLDSSWIIHCFEPNNLLSLNNRYSDLNVTMHNKAIWTYDGEIALNLYGSDRKSQGSIVVGSAGSEELIDLYDIIKTPCIDTYKFLKNFDEGDEVYIKMDIEWSEYDVLEYLLDKGWLRNIKKIWIEWHGTYLPEIEIRKNKIIERLKSYNTEVENWY